MYACLEWRLSCNVTSTGREPFVSLRVNIGCGQTPTPGWKNLDNSPSLRLARLPWLADGLRLVGLVNDRQYAFSKYARANTIEYGDAAQRLPLADGSAEVLYSSHMLEHLDRWQAEAFLREAHRVLRPGGTLRLAVPDLRLQVARYLESRDADAFVESTELAQSRPPSWLARLRASLSPPRNHRWMYDGESLRRLLQNATFCDIHVLEAGKTTIPDPGALNLFERAEESVYVEGHKPA